MYNDDIVTIAENTLRDMGTIYTKKYLYNINMNNI